MHGFGAPRYLQSSIVVRYLHSSIVCIVHTSVWSSSSTEVHTGIVDRVTVIG